MPFVRPRALTLKEMVYVVGRYDRAARNARSTDFDGSEIHAANGDLLDQFIESSTNHRSGAYDGSVENRTRLLLEIAEPLSQIWGPDRIGVRVLPLGKTNDISDDDPEVIFGYVAERLGELGLAYLHMVDPAMERMRTGKPPDQRSLALVKLIRERFKRMLIAAGGFDIGTAAQWICEGRADLVALGRMFIADPDLSERLRAGVPLNADDPIIPPWRRTAANRPGPVSTGARENFLLKVAELG